MPLKKILHHPLIKYGCIGVINTIVCIATMTLVAQLHVHYSIYTAAGYITGFITSFCLNGRFTFKTLDHQRIRFFLFLAINGYNLLQVEILQAILIEFFNWRHQLAIALGMVVYTTFGFFMNQRVVFAKTPIFLRGFYE